jgi:hypothetical protein
MRSSSVYVLIALLLPLAGIAPTAHAHGAHESAAINSASDGQAAGRGPRTWSELGRAWEFDPWVVVPLALSTWLYAGGLYQLWR